MVNENNKRYFFFVYSYWVNKGEEGKGSFSLEAIGFPSKKEITKCILNQLTDKYKPENSFSIIIENWIELSEEDYNEWIS